MVVGLTGGIASGKSFCSDYLRDQYGIYCIDADLLAREVVMPESEGLQEIRRTFGDAVILADGHLDRQRMRSMILRDDAQRARLNAIVHPRVQALMWQRLADHARPTPYKVLSVPLLFENDLHRQVDVSVVVDVDEQIQLTRVQQRDRCSEQAAQSMLAMQISRSERLRLSHFVIDNSGDKEQTRRQLDTLHGRLCSLA